MGGPACESAPAFFYPAATHQPSSSHQLPTTSSQLPVLAALCLVGDPRRGCRGGSGVAEIVVAQRFQVVVELVDQRDAGRNVQLDDIGLGDVVQVLDQRAQ